MFRYKELLRLKKRDFEFWAWKALKAKIEKEMFFVYGVRTAMATNERYSEFFHEKQSELFRLDGKLDDLYKESWDYLKMKKRG